MCQRVEILVLITDERSGSRQSEVALVSTAGAAHPPRRFVIVRFAAVQDIIGG